MRISNAFPSEYLKAADLDGRNIRVLMDRVEMIELGGEHKPALYFQGKSKAMVLNKTNATNISAAYGDDTDEWNGKEVVLYEAMVDFQGRSVAAIRVRAPTAKDRQQRPQQMRSEQAPLVNGSSSRPIGGENWPQPDTKQAPPKEMLDDDVPF